MIVAWLMAGIGLLSDVQPFATAGIVAITLVTLAPILRVGWLMFRWTEEGDWRFVWIGAGLLGIIAVAGLIALVG